MPLNRSILKIAATLLIITEISTSIFITKHTLDNLGITSLNLMLFRVK